MSIDLCFEPECGEWTAARCLICWRSFCSGHLAGHKEGHGEAEHQSEMTRRAAEQNDES